MTFAKRLPGVAAWLGLGLLLAFLPHGALGLTTGTVQGTVYRADGGVAQGTLLLSWPAFTTTANEAVASGTKTVAIGADGWVAVSLAPNAGAFPDGTYYTAVYQLNDGTTSTEYWVVPSSATISLASVRAKVMPAAMAVRMVSRQYVDDSVAGVTSGFVHATGDTMSGPLLLSSDPTTVQQAATKNYVDQAASTLLSTSGGTMKGSLLLYGDPAVDYQAATKRYVDQASSAAVSKTGATMTGPLTSPMINGKAIAVGGTLQQAINAAGTSGSVEIPANYAGTDNFTNPNNIPIKDLRASTPSAPRLATEWGVKCDGVTDDAVAIQAALNAGFRKFPIQFPQGTCLTSTITWTGQSFFGTGVHQTKFKGMPGQDVFRVPDANTVMDDYAFVSNFDIIVDSTVDASATAAGGNNTFPFRASGTEVGITPFALPFAPPITPGPMIFDDGATTAGSTTFTTNRLFFAYIPSERLIGAPITINGAGVAGAPLVTTIATLVNNTTVTLATAASTSGVYLSGTALTPLTPPWYIGNCGMAFPKYDGNSNWNNGTNNWTFTNIFIRNNDHNLGHHTCGVFLQTNSYALNWNNVRIRGFWGGYVEAPQYVNATFGANGPDTDVYNNLNIDGNTIGLVTYGGGHRTFNNLVIYASANPQALGPMMLYGFGTINNIYHECYGYNSGENSRWTLGPWNISGGSLNQCGPLATVNWMADDSKVNAQVGSMTLTGNRNTFTHTGRNISDAEVNDTGADNSVEGGGYGSSAITFRRSYANVPMDPLNKLNADFLTAGNSSTPFMNSSDLLTRCADWPFATSTFGAKLGSCIADPTGTEITKGFYRSSGISDTNAQGSLGLNSMNGKPLYVGDRIPQGPGTWVVQARCTGGSCTQNWNFGGPSCVLTFAAGSLWTTQKCAADYTGTALGTVLGFGFNAWTGAGTSIDIAYVGFEPANTDTLNTVFNSAKFSVPDGQFLTGVNVGTYFTQDMTATQTFLNAAGNLTNGVWSPAGMEKFLTGGYIQIENEMMSYTTVTGDRNGIAFNGLARGQFGTTAAAHRGWTGVTLLPIGVRVNGSLVQSCWATGCTFVTPTLGAASATSIAITTPTGIAPMSVLSTTPVANLTLASAAQVPSLPATQITGLAAVATSGSYGSLSNKPVAGTDFVAPSGSITGNASTASSLATAPTVCSAGQAAMGILANGNATGCAMYAPLSAPSFTTQATAPKFIGVISSEADIPFSATPTFSATANLNYMSLTGNVTLSTLAPGADGQSMTFVLCQDATGSRAFVWPANVRGGMTIGATASKCSSQIFTYVNPLAMWTAANAGTTNE